MREVTIFCCFWRKNMGRPMLAVNILLATACLVFSQIIYRECMTIRIFFSFIIRARASTISLISIIDFPVNCLFWLPQLKIDRMERFRIRYHQECFVWNFYQVIFNHERHVYLYLLHKCYPQFK